MLKKVLKTPEIEQGYGYSPRKAYDHFHIFKAIMRKGCNDNLKCSPENSRSVLEMSNWNVTANINSMEIDF